MQCYLASLYSHKCNRAFFTLLPKNICFPKRDMERSFDLQLVTNAKTDRRNFEVFCKGNYDGQTNRAT